MLAKVALKRIVARKTWSILLISIVAIETTTFSVIAPLIDINSKWVEFYANNIASYILVGSGSKTSYIPNLTETSFFNENEINEIRKISGVAEVYRIVSSFAYLPLNDSEVNTIKKFNLIKASNDSKRVAIAVDLVGIDLNLIKNASALPIPFTLINGEYPSKDENCILVSDSKLIEALGYRVGSEITVSIPHTHGLSNISLRVKGFVRTIPLLSFSDPFLLMDYERFFNLYEKIYNLSLPRLSSYLFVKLSRPDPELAESVKNKIYSLFGYRGNLYVFYFRDLLMRTKELVESSLFMLKAIVVTLLLLFFGSIITISFFDLIKNRNEFGLLETFGWTDEAIAEYIFSYLLIISLIGLFIGTIITLIVGNLVKDYLMLSNSQASFIVLYYPKLQSLSYSSIFISIFIVMASICLSSLLIYLFLRKITTAELLRED